MCLRGEGHGFYKKVQIGEDMLFHVGVDTEN